MTDDRYRITFRLETDAESRRHEAEEHETSCAMPTHMASPNHINLDAVASSAADDGSDWDELFDAQESIDALRGITNEKEER